MYEINTIPNNFWTTKRFQKFVNKNTFIIDFNTKDNLDERLILRICLKHIIENKKNIISPENRFRLIIECNSFK